MSAVKWLISDLRKVSRVVQLVGYINSSEEFTDQSKVLNCASNLFKKVFGEKGVHSRVAVGVNTLPLNAPLELSAIFEVK